jgi:hypothetical protein
MFVEYIYIYEQYNPETARRNTPKLKHSILIEKTKHLPKRNWQPWPKVMLASGGWLKAIDTPILLLLLLYINKKNQCFTVDCTVQSTVKHWFFRSVFFFKSCLSFFCYFFYVFCYFFSFFFVFLINFFSFSLVC